MLYDRILEAMAYMTRRGIQPKPAEADIGNRLLGAVVYEISSVVPLFGDWVRERGKPIPKRAPHPQTWCEWSETESCADGTFIRWRMGALISEHGPEVIGRIVPRLSPNTRSSDACAWSGLLLPDDQVYTVQPFKLIEEATFPTRFPRHTPMVGIPANVFAYHQTGEYVGGSLIMPDARVVGEMTEKEKEEFRLSLGAFGFGHILSVMNERYDHHQCCWPPFMAFSLLHCKNVSAEKHDPDEKTQRRARRAGGPPRSSWHTITIRVPEMHKPKVGGGDGEAGLGVRFHLCRGHFKNLKHSRFKTPGLHWWPAHWRGDPELGEVITDRKIEGSDAE